MHIMNCYILSCNIEKCRLPLNETVWVTRCLHVFCLGHGQAYFSNSSSQINCPICDEVNLREVDILQCESNPSDMVLAGVPPLKALNLAARSLKLWWSQIQEDQRSSRSKLDCLEKKNNEIMYIYNKELNKMKNKYYQAVNNLKIYCNVKTKKIEDLTNELRIVKSKLQKYKEALSAANQENLPDCSYSPPHWFSNSEDNPLDNSPPLLNNSGMNFSFNENEFFK